jgi:chromosome segregation ATPase
MRNALSKGILAAALIAAPGLARGDGGSTPQSVDQARDAALNQRVRAREAARKQALMMREQAAADLLERRRQVQALTGLVEVTPESVRQVISRLQEQREELELDAAGAQGRRQALEEAVASLSTRLKARAPVDAVVATLQKVVDVRQAQLQRLQQLYKQGAVPSSELDAAEASVATAQADVAAAQQRVAGGTAAEPLDAWNRQLLELGVSDAERQARLKFIEKRLAQFSDALQAVDQMEQQRASLDAAQSEVAASEADLRRLREMDSFTTLIAPGPATKSADKTP